MKLWITRAGMTISESRLPSIVGIFDDRDVREDAQKLGRFVPFLSGSCPQIQILERQGRLLKRRSRLPALVREQSLFGLKWGI